MAEFLWIFWSFSLLGWGLERLFAAVTRSPRRRRRCLLLLPLCPVYGLGMAAVLALPPSLRSGWPLYLWGGLTDADRERESKMNFALISPLRGQLPPMGKPIPKRPELTLRPFGYACF